MEWCATWQQPIDESAPQLLWKMAPSDHRRSDRCDRLQDASQGNNSIDGWEIEWTWPPKTDLARLILAQSHVHYWLTHPMHWHVPQTLLKKCCWSIGIKQAATSAKSVAQPTLLLGLCRRWETTSLALDVPCATGNCGSRWFNLIVVE